MVESKVWYPDLLKCNAKARAKFIKNFKNYNESNIRNLYQMAITEIEKIVVSGDIDSFKSLDWFVDYISSVNEETTLRSFSKGTNSFLQESNIIILICKHSKVKLLEYLFSTDCKFLHNFTVKLGENSSIPALEDENKHNCFYYSIRSGNVELLDVLINKWPNDYFGKNKEELDELLSSAYKELKLKNIVLKDEMQVFVENILINLRFFYESSQPKPVTSFFIIKSRVNVLNEVIDQLKVYLNSEVDERFICLLKFIARNIYILKRQLKYTYFELPWEEIEFCLVAFVSSYTIKDSINLIYSSVLNQTKIVVYLNNFSECLENEMNYIENLNLKKLSEYPQKSREDIITNITKKSPNFKELYSDYKSIRDIHSLVTIKKYMDLSKSVDPSTKEGQIIIVRTLQVVGEYFKNTIEAPKLSEYTCKVLLSLLPRNTREIIIDLRNSLSHAYSLEKRLEIEANCDSDFFKNIQKDVNKISVVIEQILFKNKICVIKILMKRIMESESVADIKEIVEALKDVELECNFNCNKLPDELIEIKKLTKEVSDQIKDKTPYEIELLNKIDNIVSLEKSRLEKMEVDYISGLLYYACFLKQTQNFNLDKNGVRGIKYQTNKILETISSKIEPNSLKEIAHASMSLLKSISLRIEGEQRSELTKLIFKVFEIAELEAGNMKWIAELKDKLGSAKICSEKIISCEKYTFKEKKMEQLVSKVTTLEYALSKNCLHTQLINNISFYKDDKQLQMVIEMLLLDIMSILEETNKNLTDNLLFLDEDSPLLVGRNLRNHLAHGNTLLDILQNDSTVAILINAKKIISENILQHQSKIGKLITNDPLKVKSRFDQELIIINKQNSLFFALVEGSFECMEKSIKDGADIFARSLNFWTALHFASYGGNAKIVHFLLDQNLNVNALDNNGQSPFHIAAASGQEIITQLLLKEHVDVEITDSSHRTSLHLAAQNGHTDVIKVLLKNKASTNCCDFVGCMPIHYAIINNHIEATEVLLEKQNIDADVMLGGFTALHVAAEHGHLELVHLLLKKKANVNAKQRQQGTPLHTASLNGHLSVVKALVLSGAHVNVKSIEGGTPLHYAVENNHKTVVEFLLKHGANVHSTDGSNFTPLNFSAGNGELEIAEILLEKKSDINHKTINGTTSLYLAAENGHLDIVKFFIRKNASLKIKDINNFTPLHVSAKNGHTDIVKFLIENGAKVNDVDVCHRTPLHLSAIGNKHKVVNILISLNANLEAEDLEGSTALHLSSQTAHLAVVKLLIENGANLNAKTKNGTSVLFAAIKSGSVELIEMLIDGGVDTNFADSFGLTPLHVSALHGNKEIVKKFILLNCDINAKCHLGLTPLHFAVQGNHREVVGMLLQNGAKVDSNVSGYSPLYLAVKNNCKEIVVDLIKCDADVNTGYPLNYAIMHGFSDITLTLIQSKRCNINISSDTGTPLHLAALHGQETVVSTLILKGADVNSTNSLNMTALHCAASKGHNTVVDILLKNNAKINIRTDTGDSPLNLAATAGHVKVVRTLLDHGANPNIADFKNRTSIEMAVAHNQLNVVEVLVKQDGIDINEKGNDDYTLLHIAAQMGYLDITKLLIENGANYNLKNMAGSKPIHIAARDGHQDILEFYLKKNVKASDLGAFGQTLLHYASLGGQSEIVKYLISQKLDVNASDNNGSKPIHVAASEGFEAIVHILIDNGAHFNAVSPTCGSALEISKLRNHKKVTKLLLLTEKIFEAVKRNNVAEIEKYINEGAVVNITNSAGITPLHYASWKGYDDIVTILVKNNANPNIIGKGGCTPLHYASKFNHFNVVKTLLLQKAAYNIACNNRKTPLDFASHTDITKLLELIQESFRSVQNGNTELISKLTKLKGKDILKVVMNAHDKDNKTIVIVGMQSDFPQMKKLKQVLQDDMSIEVNLAHGLCSQERYEEALTLFKSVFEKRKDLLGLDNPDTLKMQLMIAKMLYKQHNYKEALSMCEDAYNKQKKLFGEDNAGSLDTKRIIALIFHRQGKNEEALVMYEEFLPKQMEILGRNHLDVLGTQSEMALVLNALSKYEEALNVNNSILKIHMKRFGPNHPSTLVTQNNIAMVLSNQGKYDEALEMYTKVYEARKKVLGPNHSDTLRTSHWIANVTNLKQRNRSTEALEKVLKSQKDALGAGHLDTLTTQYNLANTLFMQGKVLESLTIYEEILDGQKAIHESNHPIIVDIEKKIKAIKFAISISGDSPSSFIPQKESQSNNIHSNLEQLFSHDKVNSQDQNSLTLLHYAASEGNELLVQQLLKLGANVMLVSNKGNTALHIASSKGFANIVDILLENVKQNICSKLIDFINMKTTGGGTTALHVAANVKIATSLLKYGAIYNITNKKGETPFSLSKQKDVIQLLEIIDKLFSGVESGNRKIVDTLRKLEHEELLSAINAHNLNKETLLQKAKKFPAIAKDIEKLLKTNK